MHSASIFKVRSKIYSGQGQAVLSAIFISCNSKQRTEKKNVRFIRIEALESADTVTPAHKVLFSFDLTHTTGIAQATQSAAH